MRFILFISIIFLLIVSPALASKHLTDTERQALIDREMNCISKSMQTAQGAESWDQICYTQEKKKYSTDTIEEKDLNYYKNQEEEKPIEVTGDYEPPTHQFSTSVDFSNIRYHEPGYMHEDGKMWGLSMAYTFRPKQNQVISSINDIFNGEDKIPNVYKLDGKFSFGTVDYKGQTQSGIPVSEESIQDYIVELRGLIGYDVRLTTSLLTPYLGIGYRYLNDAMQYEREISYLYAPIGIDINTGTNNKFSLGFNLEYDWFIGGRVKSHLGDVSSGYNPSVLENSQDKGYGLRGAVKFKAKTEKIEYYAEPFIKYWDIEDSEHTYFEYGGSPYEGWEPKNTSTEYGVKLGARF